MPVSRTGVSHSEDQQAFQQFPVEYPTALLDHGHEVRSMVSGKRRAGADQPA